MSSLSRFVISSVGRSINLFNGKLRELSYLKDTNVRDIHITSNVMREFRQGQRKVKSNVKAKTVEMDKLESETVNISSFSNTYVSNFT